MDATQSELDAVRIGYGGAGLHWVVLDEELSVAGLIAGNSSQSDPEAA